MIKLKNLIAEGRVSDILFHHTSVGSLYEILKTNRIYFTPSLGTSADNIFQKKNKFYYFSTSRIKVGGYARDLYPGWVNLVLNGRELGKNHSSVNVDYWGDMRPKADSLKTPKDRRRYLRYDENEERIISAKPFITGVKKFIDEIHILVSEEYIQNTTHASRIIDIERLANKRKIPIYFYTDENSVKTLNKRKAFTSIKDAFSYIDMDADRPTTYTRKPYSFDPMENVKLVTSLLQKGANDTLTREEKNYVSDIKYTYRDALSSLENDIHNSKTNFDDKNVVDSIYSLTRIMRRLKLKNIKEALDWIVKTHANV